ncbi:hypothetical protein [Methylobacterium planeticum]|uniref:Uncharacterized protein n=1 Tax=Methylobacterium planeticum TaxID=2615211 RepID=A0A6N6MG48_9HYPH|nr:hypothetical protein [Methylobacterium planeticum]KAB1068812.1 hypothetical protein F6X51_26215 [Methylobacterium planeticum]
MTDPDRLARFLKALELDRANRGQVKPSSAMLIGMQRMMLRLPAWCTDEADLDPGCVYGAAFEDGYLAALEKTKIVLGLPEVRGREREALELALDPELEPAEIAVRLRAAAAPVPPAEKPAGNVVSFPGRKPSLPPEPGNIA